MSEAARHPGDTASVLTYRTGIQDANISGNVHGGWIMKLCDEAAAIRRVRHGAGPAATAPARHVGGRVVTAAVDGMKFRSPVHVGDLLTLRATVNAAWRTSLEVGVRVESEEGATRDVPHTRTAFLTMVALGQDERPLAIPPLVPVTDEEKRRCADAN